MDATLNPLEIFKVACQKWLRNFLPLFSLSCLGLFLIKIAQLFQPPLQNTPALWPQSGTCGVQGLFLGSLIAYGILALAMFLVHVFLVLMLLVFLQGSPAAPRPSFESAFDQAKGRLLDYLKALLLLWGFGLGLSVIAFVLIVFGSDYFHRGFGAVNFKLFILSATSMLAVIIIIATAWYGFHFSLGPLVAAYERKPAAVALWESRSRVRGRALRYLAVLLLAVLVYAVAGGGLYAAADLFAKKRWVLRLVDPAVAAVFGPLVLAAWSESYRKLTESR